MNVVDAIKNRFSNYEYLNDEIPENIIKDIINCARLAPSAKNRQPWYFVITTNDTKDKITKIMEDKVKYILNKDEMKRIGFTSTLNITANTTKKAPVLILIFRPNDVVWKMGDRLGIGAAIENMCLRATELGIGSLWILDTVYVEKEITKLLKQEDKELVCGLLLGYQKQKTRKKIRNKINDIMEWQN